MPVYVIYIKGEHDDLEPVLGWFRGRTLLAGEEFVEDAQGSRLELEKGDDNAAQVRAQTLVDGACAETGVDRKRITLGPTPPDQQT